MAGTLCVSLDTEYFWGVHDTTTIAQYGEHVRHAREAAIPGMLRLFAAYGIHATWAFVGAALAENVQELQDYAPPKEQRPTYENPRRNPYAILPTVEEETASPSIYFAGEDAKKVRAVPGQAVGTHTFSHYYCKEAGQTVAQFRADLKAALHIAKEKGNAPTSIVYPKMEYTDAYLTASAEEGIAVFRGIEDNWGYIEANCRSLCAVHFVLRMPICP